MTELEALERDLWTRWEAQFSRLDDLQYAIPTGQVMYGPIGLFDLETYSPSGFPASKRLSSTPSNSIGEGVYYFDAQGRPRQTGHGHNVNGGDWLGFFTYAEDCV